MLSILTCYKLEKGTIKTALSKKAETRMTKEDKRRMHMSRPAMCSIQNSYIFAHSPHSKSTSTETSLSVCGSSGIRSYWVRYVTELPSSFQSATDTNDKSVCTVTCLPLPNPSLAPPPRHQHFEYLFMSFGKAICPQRKRWDQGEKEMCVCISMFSVISAEGYTQ